MDQRLIDLFGLKEYQVQAADFVLSRPSSALFLKMGLGKTRIALACICAANLPCHVLVIAPGVIARTSWIDEITGLNLPLRYESLLTGPKGGKLSKKKRHEKYEKIPGSLPTVYFISRDLITDLIDYFKNRKTAFPFPFLVIDELHSFKNHASVRFKALKSVMPHVKHVIGLTGTPEPNGPLDLWAQIYLLDQGERLCHTITGYREMFFTPGAIVNGYPVTWNPKPGAKQEIARRIKDIAISMDNSMLRLPDLTVSELRCYMDEEEMQLYRQMVRDKVIESDDMTATAANAAVLTNKLTQIASGNLYVDDTKEWFQIHKRKLELLHYIRNNEAGPLLVAYIFYTDLHDIKEEFPEAVEFDKTPQMLKQWNEGQIPMLLIHPASAGFGLNFQYGGHTLVWYSLPWSLEQYQQTNARLYRQNQTEPVVIHRLVTAKTIDERIIHALENKDMTQEYLLEAVRLTLEEI